MSEKRWEKGCASMLPVTSIFAGLSGLLLVNTASGLGHAFEPGWLVYASYAGGALAFLALFQFVRIAEKFADALDERNILHYVEGMYWFNMAVVAMFSSLAIFVSVRGVDASEGKAQWLWGFAALVIIVAPVWPGPWFRDGVFLCSRRKDARYVDFNTLTLKTITVPDSETLSEDDVEWNRWAGRLQGDP